MIGFCSVGILIMFVSQATPQQRVSRALDSLQCCCPNVSNRGVAAFFELSKNVLTGLAIYSHIIGIVFLCVYGVYTVAVRCLVGCQCLVAAPLIRFSECCLKSVVIPKYCTCVFQCNGQPPSMIFCFFYAFIRTEELLLFYYCLFSVSKGLCM